MKKLFLWVVCVFILQLNLIAAENIIFEVQRWDGGAWVPISEITIEKNNLVDWYAIPSVINGFVTTNNTIGFQYKEGTLGLHMFNAAYDFTGPGTFDNATNQAILSSTNPRLEINYQSATVNGTTPQPAQMMGISLVNAKPTINNPGTLQIAQNTTVTTGQVIANSDTTTILVNAQPAPAWVTYNNITGIFTFTPDNTIIGLFTITIEATNFFGTVQDSFKVQVLPPSAPLVGNAHAPVGAVGVVYNNNVTIENVGYGTGLTYTITNLPAGLTANENSITGTPTTAGTFVVQITATNSFGTDSGTATLVINDEGAPQINTDSLEFKYQVETTHTLDITGNNIQVTVENLPAGLTATGITIAGASLEKGDFLVRVTATNEAGTVEKDITLSVVPGFITVRLWNFRLTNGEKIIQLSPGEKYTDQDIPQSMEIVESPAEITMVKAYSYVRGRRYPQYTGDFYIDATNTHLGTEYADIPVKQEIRIDQYADGNWHNGTFWVQAPVTEGNFLPDVENNGSNLLWQVAKNKTLTESIYSTGASSFTFLENPSFLIPTEIRDIDGNLIGYSFSGTPTAIGEYLIALRAENGSGSDIIYKIVRVTETENDIIDPVEYFAENSFLAAVSNAGIGLVKCPGGGNVTGADIANAAGAGQEYYGIKFLEGEGEFSFTFNVFGDDYDGFWNFSGNISVDTNTKIYDGTLPLMSKANPYRFAFRNVYFGTNPNLGGITVTDNTSALPVWDVATTAFKTYILSENEIKLRVKRAQSVALKAGSTLPDGLSLSFDGYHAKISGIPTAIADSEQITLVATNATGDTEQVISIEVAEREGPALTSSQNPNGVVNETFNYTITFTGTDPVEIEVGAGLPAGVSYNGQNAISGTPTATGEYSVTITLTNAIGTDTKTVTITIGEESLQPVIKSNGSIFAYTGEFFQKELDISGSNEGMTIVSNPALPDGVNLSVAQQIIAGTITTAGQYQVVLTATNNYGQADQLITIQVQDRTTGDGNNGNGTNDDNLNADSNSLTVVTDDGVYTTSSNNSNGDQDSEDAAAYAVMGFTAAGVMLAAEGTATLTPKAEMPNPPEDYVDHIVNAFDVNIKTPQDTTPRGENIDKRNYDHRQ